MFFFFGFCCFLVVGKGEKVKKSRGDLKLKHWETPAGIWIMSSVKKRSGYNLGDYFFTRLIYTYSIHGLHGKPLKDYAVLFSKDFRNLIPGASGNFMGRGSQLFGFNWPNGFNFSVR